MRDISGRSPLSGEPSHGQTFQELALSQGVKPFTPDTFVGTWPGDVDDDFENAIRRLRNISARMG